MRNNGSEYYHGSVFFQCFILEMVTSNYQFLLFRLGNCREGMVALWVKYINRWCCLGVVNMDLLTPLLTPSAGIVARLYRRRLKFKHHLVQTLTIPDPSQRCVANPSRDHGTCRARFVSLHFVMVSLLVIIFVPLLEMGSNSTMKGSFIWVEASAGTRLCSGQRI